MRRIAASGPARILLLLGALYVGARVLAVVGVHARTESDTGTYEHVAKAPLFSGEFLAGWRPPTLPLLYKVLTTDDLRMAGQLAISIGCWLALAGVVSCTLTDRRMRMLSFVAILVFSLSPEVLMWDPVLLSESVSISLTAALVATWMLLLRAPTGPRIALMLVTAAAWALARDPNPYVLLLLAGVLAASLPVADQRRVRALLLAALLAISAASILSANIGFPRWQFPLQNVIALRVAADPEKLDYFEDAGMPVTPRFLELSRRFRETGENPFQPPTSSDAKLLPFQLWLAEDGRGTYGRFLLTHPGVVAEAFGHLDRGLLFPRVEGYASRPAPWRFPLLPDLLFPRNAWLPLLYLAIAVGLAIAAVGRAGERQSWVVPAFLIGSSLPFAVFVYHAGGLELDRHGVIPSLFLRLGTLLLMVVAADRLLSDHRGDRSPHPSGV